MRSSKDIFHLIDATDDPELLRNLMTEFCNCSDCKHGKTVSAAYPDSSCFLHHELEFRNLLAHLAEKLGLLPQDE